MNAGSANFIFQNPAWLAMLAVLPVLALLIGFSEKRRRRARMVFRGEGGADGRSDRQSTMKSLLLCGSCLFVVLALARPGWSPRLQPRASRSRDLVFVLDVSRSMLAGDVAPSRLARAKHIAADCLRGMSGERCALVAVAGEAAVKCPLTLDYDCLRKILLACNENSVPLGGTKLAAGIDLALREVLADSKAGYADLILITDAGDHGSDIAAAVEDMNADGARLIIVGIGSPSTGAPIPLGDGEGAVLKHAGETVLTRLDSDLLESMIERSGDGLYFELGTGNIDLREVYRQVAKESVQISHADAEFLIWREGFQIFIAIALLLMALAAFPRSLVGLSPVRARAGVYPILLATMLCISARGDEQGSAFERALAAYESKDYDLSGDLFQDALGEHPDAPEINYNLGLTRYRQQEFESAADAFTAAAEESGTVELRADCSYNLGNALFKRAAAQVGQDSEAALALFDESIACYDRSIALLKGADAVRNREIAARVYAELKKIQSSESEDSSSAEESDEGESGDDKSSAKPDYDDEFADGEGEGEEYLMPTEDPEDILEEERRNNEQRLERVEHEDSAVEKDW